MSKYSEKVARREEAARLATEEEPEPEVQPEPAADAHKDGLGIVPALDTFTADQMACYEALVAAWQVEAGQVHPGSKTRRALRATALARCACERPSRTPGRRAPHGRGQREGHAVPGLPCAPAQAG
jgi:hypothetical protein